VVLTVALGVVQLVLLARFVGRSGQASWFTAVVVVAVAWSVRAQAGAARAVVGSRTTWLDTALLRVAIPVLGAGAILVVAAAAIAHVDLLARVASEPPAVQWSVVLLALAGYLNVRAIAGALSRTPEPDESNSSAPSEPRRAGWRPRAGTSRWSNGCATPSSSWRSREAPLACSGSWSS
jgi:hypothetical protein